MLTPSATGNTTEHFYMLHLKKTNSQDIDFQELVQLLDQDLSIRDGDEHAFYAQFNTIQTLQHVVVLYQDNAAVACGAFKMYESDTVEIKRMYVRPEYRNKGLALQVLTALEMWAQAEGYTKCILETGLKQPEAIRLYEKAGYVPIPNYGQYAGVENSVCMQKG